MKGKEATEVATMLRTHFGPMFEAIEVGPSNVTNSPESYIFLYTSRKKSEGPHLIVSDRQELEEEEGYLIGTYFGADGEPFTVRSTSSSDTRLRDTVATSINSLVRELDRRHRTGETHG